jgi:hypothetical protein
MACHPEVGLDELSTYSVIFEGEQTESGVKGVVGFLNQYVSPSLRTDGRCRNFGGRLTATLASGERLARTQADCGPGEFEERFVIPEGVSDADLNVVFDDGERISRVVMPEALRPLRMEPEELTLTAEQRTPIDLGLMLGEHVFEVQAVFIDQLGTERWRTLQDFYGGIRAGPGEPPLSGRLVLSGRVRREAPVCRDFVVCESQTLFSLSVPARY